MKYNIEMSYTAGDSFNTYHEVDNIPYSWENYEFVKNAYHDIIEHYNAVKNKELPKCINKSWYSKEYPEGCIILRLDDMSLQSFNCFWIDYFGHPEKMEIKMESFTHNFW